MDKEIDVRMDSVTICGTVIKRPSRVPRSQWMQFWERLNAYGPCSADCESARV